MKAWLRCALLGMVVACGGDFDPFNLLNKFRVLAVRAEPPWIAEGQTTTVDALVYEPDGRALSYQWSWCPFTSSSSTGFECIVTYEQLQGFVAQLPPAQQFPVPPFDLGTGTTASLDYLGTPDVLLALCEILGSEEVPDFVVLPECTEGLDVTVRLEVNNGDKTAVAIKSAHMVFDGALYSNQNPQLLGGMRAQEKPNDDTKRDESLAVEITAGTSLKRRTDYFLFLDLDAGQSETYTPAPSEVEPNPQPKEENLFVTWFVEGGETDVVRTTYFPGSIPIENTRVNEWSTPDGRERPQGQSAIIVVLRDSRGGVDWQQYSVDWVAP